eukprot:8817611-Alexandrium_andersonii.AAC.1
MSEVEAELKALVPHAYTPIFSFADIEYADDTVLVAKTSRVAEILLHSLERHAGARGLELNKDKTIELPLNTTETVPVSYTHLRAHETSAHL